MKTWYDIKAKDDSAAEISIFDEIGAWGVTAKQFIGDLKSQAGKKITLSINSPGGSVFDALAIYNALRGHGSEITTKVMGVAASAASVIFMAGDKRIMPENTFLMIHNPLTFAYGNAEELRDMAEVLDKIAASLIGTYVARSGLGEEEVKALLDAETWLNAADSVEKGFADEVEPEMKIAAAVYDMERLPENIRAAFQANAGADEEKPEGEPEDDHPLDETLAAKINAVAVSAGMADHVGVWLLDDSIKSADDAKAAILQAREVNALCVMAKKPEMAAGLIRAKASVADARAKILDALADADEATHTDNSIQNKNQRQSSGADVWAKVYPPTAAKH